MRTLPSWLWWGSLLRIRSVQKSTVGAGDEIDNTIARIVKQNVDSKVQAVSSLTWASILASMGEGVSLDTLIARYNNHPEVKAFENQQATGSISLDGRKRQARSSIFCFGQPGLTPSSCSMIPPFDASRW